MPEHLVVPVAVAPIVADFRGSRTLHGLRGAYFLALGAIHMEAVDASGIRRLESSELVCEDANFVRVTLGKQGHG
jgi:hypothetical protein